MNNRAALFDLGGTLWYVASEPAWEEIYHLQGEAVRRPVMERLGASHIAPAEFLRDLWQEIDQAYQNPELRDPDLPALVGRAFADHGVEVTLTQSAEFWDATYISSRHFGSTLYPDTLDTLRDLKSGGVSIGLVTNRPHGAALLQRDLEEYGLAPYVDAVVCSADVGFIKPHPAPFERALHLLGVEASETVMVGDLLEADIQGANALGITTVWKTSLSEDALMTYEADYTISTLTELLQLGLFAPRLLK